MCHLQIARGAVGKVSASWILGLAGVAGSCGNRPERENIRMFVISLPGLTAGEVDVLLVQVVVEGAA